MKKHLFITLLAFFAFASFASAQGGLGAFMLKGKVKMVKGYVEGDGSFGESLSFSQAGKLRIHGKPAPMPKYDTKGRLIQIKGYSTTKWSYDAQGRVSQRIYDSFEDPFGEYFEYDNNGRVEKVYFFSLWEPQNKDLRYTYEYLNIDAKGNWTKRKCIDTDGNSRIEERTITYWP